MSECDRPIDAGQGVEELVARLHELLDEQLAAGREGDFSRLEQLGQQAEAVVAGIVGHGGGATVAVEACRHDLERSYSTLTLMLRAEQADVQGRLRQLRRVKRAVNAYKIDR